jgi:hypothetical protein
MAVVSDFIQLVGDTANVITSGEPPISFNTGGRTTAATAFLIFNVRRLSVAEGAVSVRVNGSIVGNIYPYPDSDQNFWYTQMIALGGNQINDGNNNLTFDRTGFEIKNMVCFFHQSA